MTWDGWLFFVLPWVVFFVVWCWPTKGTWHVRTDYAWGWNVVHALLLGLLVWSFFLEPDAWSSVLLAFLFPPAALFEAWFWGAGPGFKRLEARPD